MYYIRILVDVLTSDTYILLLLPRTTS